VTSRPRELPTFTAVAALVEALYVRNVKFLVVGGFAVHHYDPSRDVLGHDLNLLFEPTRENAAKLTEVLKAFGFTVPPDVAPRLPGNGEKTHFGLFMWRDFYPVDLLFDPSGDFDALWGTSHEARIGGAPVRVIAAQAILDRLTKDTDPKRADDIVRLRRVLGIE